MGFAYSYLFLIIHLVFFANIFLKCFQRDSNHTHHPEGIGDSLYRFISKRKIRRCSLVQFISCPRVARSYFLCDSISAAGTLTQDSLLLLPSHNIDCKSREFLNIKEKRLCKPLIFVFVFSNKVSNNKINNNSSNNHITEC